MNIRQIVARNLKALRVSNGLTQSGLAERTKVNIRHISQMENGSLNLTLDTVERLAKGLGVSSSELLKNDAERPILQGNKKELPGVDAAIRLLRSYKSNLEQS